MSLVELIDKLYWSNIPEHWYSVNEGLKSDACILYKNYSTWEFFYLDERGERHDYKFFNNEEEAFEHLWKKMEYQSEVFKIKPKDKDR